MWQTHDVLNQQHQPQQDQQQHTYLHLKSHHGVTLNQQIQDVPDHHQRQSHPDVIQDLQIPGVPGHHQQHNHQDVTQNLKIPGVIDHHRQNHPDVIQDLQIPGVQDHHHQHNHPDVTQDLQIPDVLDHHQQQNHPDVIQDLQIPGVHKLRLNHPRFHCVTLVRQTQDVLKQQLLPQDHQQHTYLHLQSHQGVNLDQLIQGAPDHYQRQNQPDVILDLQISDVPHQQ